MDEKTLYSIGDLARHTGLPVRTIRFWSDAGVLPPTHRSPANHRRYDRSAITRLELVRLLRDLGLDLATIQQVLTGDLTVPQAAALHAEALDIQIKALRVRRAVLRMAAKRDAGPKEMELMHRVVQLSEAERHRLIHDFVDSTFGAVDANPELVGLLHSAMPNLPDEPTAEQVEAWIELAELVQDADFRAGIHRMAQHQAAERADGDRTGLHHDLTGYVRDRVTAAITAGIPPSSAPAAAVVTDLVAGYARTFERTDSRDYRADLLLRLEVANDPRVERYWRLLSIINGWPTVPSLAPVFEWFIRALHHHPQPSAHAV